MAETFYFSHDYGARNDPKLIKLQMELGYEGKGLFWDLIEISYEQDGYIMESELKSIAFALHSEYERIKNVLTNFDLFVYEEGKYYSESVLRRLEIRYSKSEKARKSVNKRWEKLRKDTNVLPTNYEGNTIKESIVKDIKVNKVKDSINFYQSEIENCKGKPQYENYERFVKYLINLNPLHVFKIRDQLSYEQFELLKELEKTTGKPLKDKIDAFINDTNYSKNKVSVYLTLQKWMKS